jgi:TPR repeat protein
MGEGVEKDAAHGVSLLRQVTNREDATKTLAERTLAICYMDGNGVEADTAQAALWCQRAADGGDEWAIRKLPIIRTCDFCGTTPARQHCERCRKVRYCDATCQAAHWNRYTNPHKSHCRRRATEASQQEAGGASTSAQ